MALSQQQQKILDEMNSYSQYIQRPLSQNTNIQPGVGGGQQPKSKQLGRQSPANQNNSSSAAAANGP